MPAGPVGIHIFGQQPKPVGQRDLPPEISSVRPLDQSKMWKGADNFKQFNEISSAQTELRLRQMVKNYEDWLVREAADGEKKLTQAAEKAETRRVALDDKARRDKIRKDESYVKTYEGLLVRKERTEQQQERIRERQEAIQLRQRAKTRREAFRAFEFGGAVGGIAGGFAGGDLGGIVGALGGAVGGGLGYLAGGPVGKVIGSAVGSLAGLAVNPYDSVYRASKGYLDYQQQYFALGQNRGQSGEAVNSAIYSGAGHGVGSFTPFDWQLQNGMGARKSAQTLLDLGYTYKGDQSQILSTIGGLQTGRLAPGAFAGLGDQAVTSLFARAGAYGINSKTEGGVGGLQGTIDMLSDATSRGLDKSKLLDSVNTSLDSLVKMSGRADIANITSLTSALSQTNLPGGMVGSTAQDIISANASMGQNVLQSNMTTMALTTLLPKYNNFKTASDVAKFAGVKVGDIDPSMMSDILAAAKAGNMNTALRLINSPAVMGAGVMQQRLMEAFPNMGLPSYMRSIYGTSTGASLSASQGYVAGMPFMGMSSVDKGIMRYNGNNPAYAASVEGIYAKKFGGDVTAGWDSKTGDAGYMAKLKAAGVPQNIAALLIQSAKKDNLNPLLLASVGMQESGLNPKQGWSGYNKNGTRDWGMFQINDSNRKKFPSAFSSVQGNIQAGADYLSYTERQQGGFGLGETGNYAKDAAAAAARDDYSNLTASMQSFKMLEPAARQFSDAVTRFEQAVTEFRGDGKNSIFNNPKAPTSNDNSYMERYYRMMMTHTIAP